MGELLFLRVKPGGICEVCSTGPQALTSVGKTWICTECIEEGLEYAAKEAHKKQTMPKEE